MDVDKVISECKEKHRNGVTRESLVEHLQLCGFTITESIKVLSQALGISLGESKVIVTGHPVWTREVEASDKLHEDLERETKLHNKKRP